MFSIGLNGFLQSLPSTERGSSWRLRIDHKLSIANTVMCKVHGMMSVNIDNGIICGLEWITKFKCSDLIVEREIEVSHRRIEVMTDHRDVFGK